MAGNRKLWGKLGKTLIFMETGKVRDKMSKLYIGEKEAFEHFYLFIQQNFVQNENSIWNVKIAKRIKIMCDICILNVFLHHISMACQNYLYMHKQNRKLNFFNILRYIVLWYHDILDFNYNLL